MNIPKDLLYTKTHEWIRVDGDVAYVGITEFAAEQLGEIAFVEIETEGEELGKGEVFGSIEAVKTASDSYMPVSGEVLEANELVKDDPTLVNSDSFGKGWLIKIKISDPAELAELIKPAEYETLVHA
ncbi:MAG TPA: glycine cleavage system protein GcvH [Bacteroidales bacterium]|nr:glycine cleavage system protein GcvH [Bacteroidales bacterium]HQL69574.1 glycine cleavage system protein GcvH [Bacteroidales bacterium]